MVRVIAGSLRGRKLITNDSEQTRPTLDRVKEAMFSIILPYIYGAKVLDLFAGNGSLGIEALSRGAEYTVFADISLPCCEIIRKNLKNTGAEAKSKVHRSSYEEVLSLLKQQGCRFDVVLLDPPYRGGLAEKAMLRLSELELVSESGIICVEHAAEEQPEKKYGKFVWEKTRVYGKAAVSIFFSGDA